MIEVESSQPSLRGTTACCQHDARSEGWLLQQVSRYIAGSRVLSLASVHSTSSARSFSARRYEREKEQRLARERARDVSPNPRSTEQLLSEQSHVSKLNEQFSIFAVVYQVSRALSLNFFQRSKHGFM